MGPIVSTREPFRATRNCSACCLSALAASRTTRITWFDSTGTHEHRSFIALVPLCGLPGLAIPVAFHVKHLFRLDAGGPGYVFASGTRFRRRYWWKGSLLSRSEMYAGLNVLLHRLTGVASVGACAWKGVQP